MKVIDNLAEGKKKRVWKKEFDLLTPEGEQGFDEMALRWESRDPTTPPPPAAGAGAGGPLSLPTAYEGWRLLLMSRERLVAGKPSPARRWS